jgi:hypothetical protein
MPLLELVKAVVAVKAWRGAARRGGARRSRRSRCGGRGGVGHGKARRLRRGEAGSGRVWYGEAVVA